MVPVMPKNKQADVEDQGTLVTVEVPTGPETTEDDDDVNSNTWLDDVDASSNKLKDIFNASCNNRPRSPLFDGLSAFHSYAKTPDLSRGFDLVNHAIHNTLFYKFRKIYLRQE